MRTTVIATVLTAGLVSGCAVGPNYARPEVPTPAAFRADTAQADLASLADVKWFELFKDERLQDMIRTALVQNFDLRDAVVRVELARANLGITRADQFPTIEASADMTAQRSAGQSRRASSGTIGAKSWPSAPRPCSQTTLHAGAAAVSCSTVSSMRRFAAVNGRDCARVQALFPLPSWERVPRAARRERGV